MACGTIRANRVPREIRQATVPESRIVMKTAGPMLCIKFRDRQDVHVLTTKHDTSTQRVQVRGRRRQPADQRQLKPLAVIQYNANMGGVDKQDQVNICFCNV